MLNIIYSVTDRLKFGSAGKGVKARMDSFGGGIVRKEKRRKGKGERYMGRYLYP